jgi:hypothetical protein
MEGKISMIKYLYVLVGDDADYYLEQALLSITSLKMRMPDAFVSLLVDDKTAALLKGNRNQIHNLINEYKIIQLSNSLTKKQRSRWLKTSMRNHIEGDFLYIDCDTIIADNLDDIKDLDSHIGAVLDLHNPLNFRPITRHIIVDAKKLGFTAPFVNNKYFNGGIMFCRDSDICHNFFDEWHKLWVYGLSKNIYTDQPSLNQSNVNCNDVIEELDGTWNCQIEYGGLAYLQNAKIIHYFSSNAWENPYLIGNDSFLKKIRDNNGFIPNDIAEMLEKEKTLFYNHTRLISDKKIFYVIDSEIFLVLKKVSNSIVFKFFDQLVFIIHCIIKRFKKY